MRTDDALAGHCSLSFSIVDPYGAFSAGIIGLSGCHEMEREWSLEGIWTSFTCGSNH